jgi:hypothetical protein
MKSHKISLATLMMTIVLVIAILYVANTAFASTMNVPVDSQAVTSLGPLTISSSHASSSDSNKTSYVTKQQVNGIEVEIVGKQVMDNFLLVDICFQVPDNKDWLLGARPEDIVLTVGTQTISHSGWSVIDEKTNDDGTMVRCVQVKFQLSGQEDLSKFGITVNHLITSIPEIPDCDKAQAKLDKKNTGIKIKCTKTESLFSYEVKQKPEKMSSYEVQQSIDAAFRESIDGPWAFTDSLNN